MIREVWAKKNLITILVMRFVKERQRPTLPPVAVPSALMGLTSLFGMVRGEPHCDNHLKSLQYISTVKVNILVKSYPKSSKSLLPATRTGIRT